MNFSKIKVLSALGLILTTIIWGSSFVVMKNIVERISPLYLLAVRFTLAGIIGVIIFYKTVKKLNRKDVISGLLCGFWLATAYILQTYGLKYTSASNNTFITTFYVILAPFIFRMFRRGRVGARDYVAAAVALVGIALLSITEAGLSAVRLGDVLTLICSVAYAIHIFVVDCSTENKNPVLLAVLQLLGAALMCWICAPILEGAPPVELVTNVDVILSLLYLALFSTMFAFIMQTVAQKYLSSLTVSILISLECVFGALFSIIFLHDPFTLQIFAGFIFMAAAIAISTIKKIPDPNSEEAAG